MTWTDLSSAFTYNSQLTSAQQRALRDNITALANGDAGAPRIQQYALGHQPKNIINICCKGASVLNGETGAFLFYKNAYDKTLHGRVYGVVARTESGFMPASGVTMQLKVCHGDQTRLSAVTEIPYKGASAPAAWYDLPPLDLSEIPDDVMLEITLCSNMGLNGIYIYYQFVAGNIAFFSAPA